MSSKAKRKEKERKMWNDIERDKLLYDTKDKRNMCTIMNDDKFYQCMEELTMTYIMVKFHEQSLCKQWLAMLRIIKKRADKEAKLSDINNTTMKIFRMASSIIYPGQCHCNGQKSNENIAVKERIQAIHFSLDSIWTWSGNKGFQFTKMILECEIDNKVEIDQYSFEHILTSPRAKRCFNRTIKTSFSPQELADIRVELILEIASPKERVEMLREIGFMEYLDKRVKDLMNAPKCEIKAVINKAK
jgi:hypothetical protein